MLHPRLEVSRAMLCDSDTYITSRENGFWIVNAT